MLRFAVVMSVPRGPLGTSQIDPEGCQSVAHQLVVSVDILLEVPKAVTLEAEGILSRCAL